jgi:hypothetical protein
MSRERPDGRSSSAMTATASDLPGNIEPPVTP